MSGVCGQCGAQVSGERWPPGQPVVCGRCAPGRPAPDAPAPPPPPPPPRPGAHETRLARNRRARAIAIASAFAVLIAVVPALLLARGGCRGGAGGGHGFGTPAGADGTDAYAGRTRHGAGGGDGGAEAASGTPDGRADAAPEGGPAAQSGEGAAAAAANAQETAGTAPPPPPAPTSSVITLSVAMTPPVPVTPAPPTAAPSPLSGRAAVAPAAPASPLGGAAAGAPGGPYGQRAGSAHGRGTGATPASEAAVEAGLEWLARVQQKDGRWVDGAHETGPTALALLAFLGAGHTHRDKGKYQQTVKRGLDWLLAQEEGVGAAAGPARPRAAAGRHAAGASGQQRGPGWFAQRTFYEQGIATMALCESYGMTRDPALRLPAQNALNCIVENMGPGGGYGYGGPGDDTHVTSFQVMGLKSGALAGLNVLKTVAPKLLAYYDRSLSEDGTTGYSSGSMRGAPGGARTAMALFCRIFLGCGLREAGVRKISEVVHAAGPQVRDVFQTYYGTYAMFQVGGNYWKAWNDAFREPVIALQRQDGPDRGKWSGAYGDVCETALRVMSLEVYYRFLPVNK